MSARLATLARRLRADLWDRPDAHFAPLDGLRGVASIIVVVYHCGMFTGLFTPPQLDDPQLALRRFVLNGFWSGIDIFFVLSGFLIGRILITELSRDGRIHYRKFLIRRSFRIFPAYYLVLTLSVFVISRLSFPGYGFLYGAGDRAPVVAHAWANYLYVNNYVYPGAKPNPFSWGWSLCVEEHFYLILPPLLWACFRLRREAARWAVLVACVLLPLAWRGVLYARQPDVRLLDGLYYYSHNRFDEIFVGVVIAWGYVRHRAALAALVQRAGHATWILGLACVATVWVGGGLQEHGVFAVVFQFFVMALGSGLLVLNGLFLPNAVTRALSHPVLYFLARISYGTYLVHPFVLFGLLAAFEPWLQPITGLSGPVFAAFTLAVFVAATAVACLLFLLVEGPMLDRGVALAARYALPPRAPAAPAVRDAAG